MILTKLSVKAHGSARFLGNSTASDLDAVAIAGGQGDTPDCRNLGYPVDEDPRWDFGKIKSISLPMTQPSHISHIIHVSLLCPVFARFGNATADWLHPLIQKFEQRPLPSPNASVGKKWRS